MLNVSRRSKEDHRQKMKRLNDMAAKIADCSKCSLHGTRKAALPGRFVEPSDAMIIDFMPHPTEDAGGQLLCNGRDKSFAKMFSLSEPVIDINRMSYVTAYKCYGPKANGEVCFEYLNSQIEILDPILVVTLGGDARNVVGGKSIKYGTPYSAGKDGQYMMFALIHPKTVQADQQKMFPVWKRMIAKLAETASKYDLKIFKS